MCPLRLWGCLVSEQRCAVCDRPAATEDQWSTLLGGEGEDLCWGGAQCAAGAVDWRARALAAEAQAEAKESLVAVVKERDATIAHLRAREDHFARVLGVADGGRYRADWDGAVHRLVERAEKAEAALAACRCKTGGAR